MRISSPWLKAALLLVLLAGCSKLEVLDAVVPGGGYTLTPNIAYGDLPRQTMDIYLPASASDPNEKRPVVLFFYGGGWQRGAKEDYRFVGQALANQGYVAVVADYRLYPEVYFPAFLNDSAQATAWVHHHIAQYGGDPENLYVAGHSAGAYNAIMLALDGRYMKKAGGSPHWIRGVISLAGPYNFLPIRDEKIRDLFSTAPGPETQPISYIPPDARRLPPMFLATGDEDSIVLPANLRSFDDRLTEHGGTAQVHVYRYLDHPGIVLAMAGGFRRTAPVLEDISRFIEQTRR